MPRILPLPLALGVLLLGACGTSDPVIPSATSSSRTPQASFPLTVSRVGGIAGFNDTMSIQSDGAVAARTRQGQVTCTLDKESLAVLDRAAATIQDTDQPTTPASPPADAMVVMLGAGTGLVDVHDARVAQAEPVVTQLLSDVTGPVAGRKICT